MCYCFSASFDEPRVMGPMSSLLGLSCP